jgi:transposase
LGESVSTQRAPLAVAAVRRIDAIFEIEGEINGLPAEQRLAVRATPNAPLVVELERWIAASGSGCPAEPMSPKPWITC